VYDSQLIDKAIGEQNLTNEKLAVSAGLSSGTVSSIRNGEENIRLPSLKRVANALGYEVEIRFVPKAATAPAAAGA
jgi:transcriptional regulator with XRE-family HTH domain